MFSATAAVLLAASLAACASGPRIEAQMAPQSGKQGGARMPAPSYLAKASEPAPSEPKESPDPLEEMNRKVQDFNSGVNHGLVYPVAKAYRETVPEPVRDRIDAFTTNLSEPMTFANNVLQLRPDAALVTLARFITNSTVGLGGLFDVAATVGQKKQSGDFGQTLYVWGVEESPYLVLPVLGPTNVRDALGTGVELLAPSQALPLLPTKMATLVQNANTVDTYGKPVAGLGKVELMEEIEASSLDFYAMLRSMSDQKRQAELKEARDQSLLYWQPPNSASASAEAKQSAILDTPPPAGEMKPLVKRRVVIGEPRIE